MRDDGRIRNVLITSRTDGELHGISGVLLSDDWILTHGSLLAVRFFESASSTAIQDFLDDERENLEEKLVAVPGELGETLQLRVSFNDKSFISKSRSILEKPCSLKYAWRCSLMRKTFNEQMFSWSFGKSKRYDKSLLPLFLLLRIEDSNCTIDGETVLRETLDRLRSSEAQVKRGLPLEIKSTPFGNPSFLNSVSRGIVSNVIGICDCLVLSDASAVPGSEGAPVLLLDHRNGEEKTFFGLVVATRSWCRGESVDYAFVANLRVCLGNAFARMGDRKLGAKSKIQSSTRNDDVLLDSLDESLVVVKCGSEWGTGIIVDADSGAILTCSHVVREMRGARIQVLLPGQRDSGTEVWAKLVYRTEDGRPYDVAVLKLEKERNDLRALPLASELPAMGTAVTTAGFPFFYRPLASYARGHISRVTPFALQTTCCVQSGTSGGPIVDCATGKMLGLVVSNTIEAGGRLYTRINMAVPATVLRQPIFDYLRTGDARHLEVLSSRDPAVEETWNSHLTPRSKM